MNKQAPFNPSSIRFGGALVYTHREINKMMPPTRRSARIKELKERKFLNTPLIVVVVKGRSHKLSARLKHN